MITLTAQCNGTRGPEGWCPNHFNHRIELYYNCALTAHSMITDMNIALKVLGWQVIERPLDQSNPAAVTWTITCPDCMKDTPTN